MQSGRRILFHRILKCDRLMQKYDLRFICQSPVSFSEKTSLAGSEEKNSLDINQFWLRKTRDF